VHGTSPLLAAGSLGDPLALVLAAGLVVVFVFLAVLVWTSWGQARPISKCVVLSLLAHVLLLVYAYSTQVLFATPGKWSGRSVTIRLHDAADDEEAAPQAATAPLPWEQTGSIDVPLSSAPPLETIEPQVESVASESSPRADSAEAAVADSQPPADTLVEPAPPVEAVAEAAPQTTRDGLPDEIITPAAEMPRLTERLPESDPPDLPRVADAALPPAATDVPTAPPLKEESPRNDLTEPQFASAPATPRRLGDGQQVPEPLQARVAADRLKMAQQFGATPRTEAAVEAALAYLVHTQSDDGRWDAGLYGAGRERRPIGGHDRGVTGAEAHTGITGLALLAFLGAGHTHLAGEHRVAVQRGLEWLLATQRRDGNLAGNAEFFASMYCHGMATLALSEAYALSGDERLLPGLRLALQYTINSQHTGGGWRYQPYDAGDMSQFGWQLMALRSAELGGIPIPATTRARMVRFLQSCSSGQRRGLASYRPGDRPSRTMTAEALVCRYFLAAENAPAALDEAAAYVIEERPGIGQTNLYYWYYGTLALFQRQGDDWISWNGAMQHELLTRQRWDGDAAGSWDPDDVWGGYGGRIYSTALAALCLEVYYRYLPAHDRRPDSRLTELPWQPGVPR
jgi:hypothetical protein